MKLLMENWRSYKKQLLKEGSKFSKELTNMMNIDQNLRNLFNIEMKEAGGWSQELVNQFAKKHGTAPDDVFGSRSVEENFAKLFPQLDFANFDKKDWDNFNVLIIHQRRPEYSQMRKRALSEMIKAKKEWKSLATDMARQAKILPEFDNQKLIYPTDIEDGGKVDLLLKKKKITWEQLAKNLMR